MLAIERRNEILEKLQAEKKVVVSELSQLYKVSEETIRRDLEKLENDGFAIKSYGGAVINESSNIELPFNIRQNRNVVGKQKIAEQIMDLIHDGESIMLDASSTSVFISRKLKEEKEHMSVITNSLEIVIGLFGVAGFYVLSTGGLAKEGALALVGPQTDRMLETYHVDMAIVSCKGLDLTAGITDSDELHAKNKQTMLKAAKEKILVVDSTKFDKVAFTKIADIKELTAVVTDVKPEGKWIQMLENEGVKCIYPQ